MSSMSTSDRAPMPRSADFELLSWYRNTFPSRAATTALLSPERENGTITPSDFNKAVEFLPDPTTYKNLFLLVVGIPVITSALYMSQKSQNSFRRRFLLPFLAGVGGPLILMHDTDSRRILAHISFEKKLEDSAGFADAMKNVGMRLGSSNIRNFVFIGSRIESLEKNQTLQDESRTPSNDNVASPDHNLTVRERVARRLADVQERAAKVAEERNRSLERALQERNKRRTTSRESGVFAGDEVASGTDSDTAWSSSADQQQRLEESPRTGPRQSSSTRRQHTPTPQARSSPSGDSPEEDRTFSSKTSQAEPPTSHATKPAQQHDQSPKSRWDQIRDANSRSSAGPSSWDALRQSHERRRIPDGDDPRSTDDERAAEQAKFDAMLEAERRKAQA